MLRIFTFNMIIDKVRFKSIILLFIFYLSHLFFNLFTPFFWIEYLRVLYVISFVGLLSMLFLYYFCDCFKVYNINLQLIKVYLQLILYSFSYSTRVLQSKLPFRLIQLLCYCCQIFYFEIYYKPYIIFVSTQLSFA